MPTERQTARERLRDHLFTWHDVNYAKTAGILMDALDEWHRGDHKDRATRHAYHQISDLSAALPGELPGAF
jgi:hypothetical protein